MTSLMHIYALSFIITTWKTRFFLPQGMKLCEVWQNIPSSKVQICKIQKRWNFFYKKHLSVYWLGEHLDTQVLLESRRMLARPRHSFWGTPACLVEVCAAQPGSRQVTFGDGGNCWLSGVSQRIPSRFHSQGSLQKTFLLPWLNVIHYPPKVKSYDPISSVS